VQPYFRAPHLFLGFPTRFLPDRSVENRTTRDNAGTTEPVFMSSRDGTIFRRWAEAIIPQTAPKERMGNRSNYIALGILQLPGADREFSVYASEAGYDFGPARLGRFTYRIDGFVSLNAPKAGEIMTKPFRFEGKKLEINARTSKDGSIRVELCNQAGQPLPGFTAADSVPISGDKIAGTVKWKGNPDLSAHAGMRVKLREKLEPRRASGGAERGVGAAPQVGRAS
jgi:hypothetical protein